MNKQLAGTISIHRVHSSHEPRNFIQIRITDELSRSCVLETDISMEVFAFAITGSGDIPVVCEWHTDNLGKVAQNKEEVVHIPEFSFDKDLDTQVLAPFEVDGWVARENDLHNHHRIFTGKDGKYYARVVFFRHVDQDETSN